MLADWLLKATRANCWHVVRSGLHRRVFFSTDTCRTETSATELTVGHVKYSVIFHDTTCVLWCSRHIPLGDYNTVSKIITTPTLCWHWRPTQLLTTRLCKFRQPLARTHTHTHCEGQAGVSLCGFLFCFLPFLVPVSTRGGSNLPIMIKDTHNIQLLISAPPLWTEAVTRRSRI